MIDATRERGSSSRGGAGAPKGVLARVLRWVGISKLFSAPRRVAKKTLERYFSGKDIVPVFAYLPNGRATLKLIARIKSETDLLLGDLEAFELYQAVTKTQKLPGEIAEVGVFRGGSAKLIAETSGKQIHLFDTFEGLPDLTQEDRPEQFQKGDYSISLESVEQYLQSYPNVTLYKGFFPATAGPVEDKRFSFVHLDVDLYRPTLESLAFFYPRMTKGGLIIGHDYRDIPRFHDSGVKKAFDEFFVDKPEVVIELLDGSQCLVVKS